MGEHSNLFQVKSSSRNLSRKINPIHQSPTQQGNVVPWQIQPSGLKEQQRKPVSIYCVKIHDCAFCMPYSCRKGTAILHITCCPFLAACNCNPEGTSWPRCDKATGVCNCRAGVTGRFCDQCGRGFEKDFPSCRHCHLCFDEWDNEITALAQTVQGLMRFAASLEDKGGRMPSCDMRFKAFEDAISEVERILKHPVFSWEALSSIKDFHGYLQ